MEIWKPIPGLWGKTYSVSNTGRVKNHITDTVLSLMNTGRAGNKRRKLRVCSNPIIDLNVAHLVLGAFVSARPSEQYYALHLDNNSTNNAVENLVWGTQKTNMEHKELHGTTIRKLSRADVAEIRRRRTAGEQGRVLASEFQVSEQLICDIYKGRSTYG